MSSMAHDLRPIFQNETDMKEEAIRLGFISTSRKEDFYGPRQLLIRSAYKSMSVGRSLNHVTLLCLGLSGAGKSSTINHLLGTNLATVSNSTSETHHTQEYLLTANDPTLGVSNLTLGIVDTPGFCDDNGSMQDGCNLASIKTFCHSAHPSLVGKVPNIILLFLKLSFNRTGSFFDSLKAFDTLEIIDKKHPNVVVVFTHALSIPHLNVAKWKKDIEAKKTMIKNMLVKAWGISPPVVVMENDIVGWQLERFGDQTQLPDGTLQPKQLFLEITRLLASNRDDLGLMTLKRFFALSTSTEKTITRGVSVQAKNAALEQLNKTELELARLCGRLSNSSDSTPEVMQMINQYIISMENLSEVDECEILEMSASLVNKCGFLTASEVAIHTIRSLSILTNSIPSTSVQKMLESVFGLKIGDFNISVSVFDGYDLLKDLYVKKSCFFAYKDMPCLMHPDSICIKLWNESRTISNLFGTQSDLVNHRLDQLKVNLDVDISLFKFNAVPGITLSDDTEGSFLYEKRDLKIGITDLWQTRPDFDFVHSVRSKELPESYTISDPKNRASYQKFFTKWGTSVVTSIFFGGSVEVKFPMPRDSNGQLDEEALTEIKTGLSEIVHLLSTGSDMAQEKLQFWSQIIDLGSMRIIWKGGDPKLDQPRSLLQANIDQWSLWESSLAAFPVPLFTEFSLTPIYNLVELIDAGKVSGCKQALMDYVIGKFAVFQTVEVLGALSLQELESQDESCPAKAQPHGDGNPVTSQDDSCNQLPLVEHSHVEHHQHQEPADVMESLTKNEDIANHTQPGSSCFPGTGRIRVEGQSLSKPMKDLKIGEKVLSWDKKSGKLVYSKVFMFSHRSETKGSNYVRIITQSGHQISLSPKHLIAVNVNNKAFFKFSDEISIGDTIFVHLDSMQATQVTGVERFRATGFYAPMTMSGTIIVDNILASCYAHVPAIGSISGHEVAHGSMAPIRISYKLGLLKEDPKKQDEQEMPTIIKSTMKLASGILKF